MSAKQDRQYPRTAVDLERRYNVRKLEKDIKETANSVTELDKSLDHDEIFKRLTNDGAIEGIYRDAAGNVYVNASYIKGGLIDTALLDVDEIFAQEINAERVNIISGTESGGFNAASANGHGGFQMDYYGNSMGGYYTDWEAPGSSLNIKGEYGVLIDPGLGGHPYGDDIILKGGTTIEGDLYVSGDVDGAFFAYKGKLTSSDDLNNVMDRGFYYYDTGNAPANTPFPNASIVIVFNTGSTNSQTIQMVFRYGAAGYGKFRGRATAGWTEWSEFAGLIEDTDYPGCYYRYTNGVKEWVNPPMIPGVAYRTTERKNGNAVYVLRTDLGTLPASGRSEVAHNLGVSRTEFVGYRAYAVGIDAYDYRPFPVIDRTSGAVMASIRCLAQKFEITAHDDVSGFTGFVDLKYYAS